MDDAHTGIGYKTLPRPGVTIFERNAFMKSLASWIVLTIVFGIAAAKAQVVSAPASIQLNSIYAGADGKFEAAPDTAVIRMDVASQQDTSRAAYDHAAAAVEHVRQVLRSNGIDVKSAQFGGYQMQSIYDWKNP